jgi:two-component system LytT family sensor kinase
MPNWSILKDYSDGASANTRAIGAVAAGLLCGPHIGAAVGLIAGIERYMMGGFSAAG